MDDPKEWLINLQDCYLQLNCAFGNDRARDLAKSIFENFYRADLVHPTSATTPPPNLSDYPTHLEANECANENELPTEKPHIQWRMRLRSRKPIGVLSLPEKRCKKKKMRL